MKKNLIVLFYPKNEKENINKNIPLCLLKVGSELKDAGYKIVIIDERFEENYAGYLEKILPETLFLGVSSMTGYQIAGGIKASSLVKKINNEVPIVWGGWHPSILPEETIINQNIDIVVMGQGEITIRELARTLSHNLELQKVDGIAYKNNGRVIFNRSRQFQDVNGFSPIAFDLFEFERYILKAPLLGDRTIYWNSSQGCPYRCGFCSTAVVYDRRWSGLKAETLLEQLKTLVYGYNIEGVTFTDDNFFVDIQRVANLCRGIIDNNIKVKWATDVRVDQINRFSETFFDLLKKSGCIKLYIGAESGDDNVLELIDKKIKPDDTYKVADKLDKYKIVAEFFVMVGFPENPKKDLKNTLGMIKKIKSNYSDHQFTPSIYTPYPGTPLFDLAIKNGLEVPKELEGWAGWNILSVRTPWINERYIDCINMFSKCFYPLAFSSASLRKKFKKRFGLLYRILHISSRFRVKNDFFLFPLEWKLIKMFYRLKIKFNLFTDIESFR